MRSSPPARPAPTMAAAVFRLGRIEGIDRPALAAHLVTANGPILILDVGANVDSDATNLLHYAVMGSIYAEQVLKVPRPRIGLLNIGEEEEKGDALARAAYRRIREGGLNFIGNVEGTDLVGHVADVVVCDGFIGNVVVKFFEGLTSYIFRSVREDLNQGPIAPLALLALKPGFDRIRHRFDYERFGGTPLLGVRGVSIVTHGRAKARMIRYAMEAASDASAARIPELIAQWTRAHPATGGLRARIGRQARARRAGLTDGDDDGRRLGPSAVPASAPRSHRSPPGAHGALRGGVPAAPGERGARSPGRPSAPPRSRSPNMRAGSCSGSSSTGTRSTAGSPSWPPRSPSRSSEKWSGRSSGAPCLRCYTPPRPRAGRRSTTPFRSPGSTLEMRPAVL